MAIITFILVYILIGIIFASFFAWCEIKEVFDRSESESQNPLTKEEWQEFIVLISTCIFGWGVLLIMTIIDSIKGIWKK